MGLHVALSMRMTDLRDQQLAWLDHITQTAKMSLTEIARAAGLTPSTLTRFRQNDAMGHTLTAKTVRKIEDATHIPAYETKNIPKIQFFSENEAARYSIGADKDDVVNVAIDSLVKQTPTMDAWVLKTNALSALGYLPGMIVIIDREAQPRNGDAVCAQKYDLRRGTAETIFRVWRNPYLLSASAAGEPTAPEIVDDENVAIAGVVIGGFRTRN